MDGDDCKRCAGAPRGTRDVHWCDVTSEPVIITYRQRQDVKAAFCSGCGMWAGEDGEEALDEFGMSEDFLSFHQFCLYVLKPR